eukprot:15465389-Alexandrium_andersonii.AAC.1
MELGGRGSGPQASRLRCVGRQGVPSACAQLLSNQAAVRFGPVGDPGTDAAPGGAACSAGT